MKPYPEYKPIGLAWLPEIPRHWTTRKIKYIFRERSEKGYPDEPLLAATQNHGVIPKSLYGARTVEAQKDLHLLKLVRVGDFVISLRSFQGGIEYAYYQGIISPAYTIMIPDSCLIDSGYFRYLAKSPNFIALLQTCVTGIREGQNIDYSTLRRHSLPLPPADEQAQIVRYLDSMTAKINKLIRAKKRQIALLQEQKQAIINQAVTRGLDPDVELKDSGIDWLGPIPKHWKTCRCRYLFKEKNNRSETGNEVHLSMSQRHGLIPDSKLAERCILSETYVGGKLCLKDDLVLNRLKAHLGVFSLAQQSGVVSPDYTVLQVYKSKILPQYSELVLKSQSCRRELQLRVRGIVEGFWRLYTDDFNEISLPLPSLREQQKILASILDKSEKINLIIQQGRKKISLLTEYKNALIAAVVTGKVDVRNIAVEAVSPEDLAPSGDPDESEEQDSLTPEESEE